MLPLPTAPPMRNSPNTWASTTVAAMWIVPRLESKATPPRRIPLDSHRPGKAQERTHLMHQGPPAVELVAPQVGAGLGDQAEPATTQGAGGVGDGLHGKQ